MEQPKWRAVAWSQGYNPGWRGDAMDHFVGKVGEQKLADLMGAKPRRVANVSAEAEPAKPAKIKNAGKPNRREKYGKGELARKVSAEAKNWRSTRELADKFCVEMGTMQITLNRMERNGHVKSKLEMHNDRMSRLWIACTDMETHLSESERAVFEAFKDGCVTASEVARRVKKERRTVSRIGVRLVNRGFLEMQTIRGRSSFSVKEDRST